MSDLAQALAEDKERKRRAALKNLQYIHKKEMVEVEKRIAEATEEPEKQEAPAAKRFKSSDGSGSSSSGSKSKNSQNTSIYITGLPKTTTTKQLENQFSASGRVKRVKIYTDAATGQLKGDALLTFAKAGSVSDAIRRFNGAGIGGSKEPLVVTQAEFSNKPAQSDPSIGEIEFEPVFLGIVPPPPLARTLILKNMFQPSALEKKGATEIIQADVQIECGKYGKVQNVECLSDGSVVVQYENCEQAAQCVNVMHGRWFDERQIVADYVQEADDSTQKEDGTQPYRAVVICHAFLLQQAENTQQMEELENEFHMECSRFGPMVSLNMDREHCYICVVYESSISAHECIQVMHGRWFDERQLEAGYDYRNKSVSTSAEFIEKHRIKEEVDDDTKLENFLEFVGE